MTDEKMKAKALAHQLLTLFPPLVQSSISNDLGFRRRYGFSLDATITFPESTVAIRRSVLHPAIRELYNDGKASVEVATTDGRIAQFSIEPGDKPLVFMTVGDSRVPARSFWMLADDPALRLANFEEEVHGLNVAPDVSARWKDRIEERALSDDEIDEFFDFLRLSPEKVEDAIRKELQKADGQAAVLVPTSPEYFLGLIGNRGAAANIAEYADGNARDHIQHLLNGNFEHGLAHCLLFSANPGISALIRIADRPAEQVQRFFEWLATEADRFSQIAGIELGIRSVTRFPGLEPLLVCLLEEIRDERTSDVAGRSRLTVNLFVFVDGELARTRSFANEPPFWRRLAAIAQASMIERVIIELGGAGEDSSEWLRMRSEHFFMQSQADLRQEPRWLPDLMSPEQLRLEFLMRARIVGLEVKDTLFDGPLRSILLGDGPDQLEALTSVPSAFAPSPVEGGMQAPLPFPAEMMGDLRSSDESEVVEARVFATVVNFCMVFRFDEEIAGLIAELLRKVKYRLSLGSDTDISFTIIMGLAMIAASAKHVGLADEVRILARVLRRRGDLTTDAESQMRVALLACASRTEIQDWCKAVGDWLFEVVNEDIDRLGASNFRSHLRRLCFSVPALWEHVSKVDATLAAFSE